ncbi:alpha-amylase family protein [Cryobacterium sp. BB307]|uniref:alpha-amylase n=1 Tax=Cryobacterium sp. BB307 TaxID=2716317 RepID=UPI001447619F|nr:alpha-amylase family protein [Cryobacterium sp. BB307]
MRRRSTRLVAAALAAVVTLSLVACTPGDPTVPSPAGTRDVGIQLFQWNWNSIATECIDVLGPAGISWVLTSPPQEHITGPEWWTSYQPVSYQVESRLGTREEFAAMTETCADAGVEIIADAVINHMTGQDAPGTGWAGSAFEHYDYPGIYGEADFHHCTDTASGDILDYNDADQVQNCELLNLADLATETDHVRETLTAYLLDLLDLGVAGFRIDAAKHMPAEDVKAVVDALPDGTRIMQEVIRASLEPITPEQYVGNGQVFEFTFARDLKSMLDSAFIETADRVGPQYAQLASEDAIVFVTNHDTERNGETLSYRDGDAYLLANIAMLAQPYGTPVLYSGYPFEDRNQGPPQDADGRVQDVDCDSGQWECLQRWAPIERMLAWRSAVGDAAVQDVVKEDGVWAFYRGELGFVVLNSNTEPYEAELPTSLVPGRYVDAITGLEAMVHPDGTVNVSVAPLSALAIDVSTWMSTAGRNP